MNTMNTEQDNSDSSENEYIQVPCRFSGWKFKKANKSNGQMKNFRDLTNKQELKGMTMLQNLTANKKAATNKSIDVTASRKPAFKMPEGNVSFMRNASHEEI